MPLPPIAVKVPIPAGFPTDIDEFVKFPEVSKDQYSVLLLFESVPSTLLVPPEAAVTASTVTATAPAPVVGFTSEKGR